MSLPLGAAMAVATMVAAVQSTRMDKEEQMPTAENDAPEVSVAIKAQNPDLETAWRTISWWEQTCAYWRDEAHKGYALRDRLATRVIPPGRGEEPCDTADPAPE